MTLCISLRSCIGYELESDCPYHYLVCNHLLVLLYIDPEEFLNLLFKHVLALEDPFIHLK